MFDPKAIQDAKKHAIESFPNEACGAVTSEGYHPFQNVSGTPEKSFDCIKEGQLFQLSHTLITLIHSHPVTSKFLMEDTTGPSRGDMQQQIVMNIPWGIIDTDGKNANEPYFWGCGIPIPQLEGRQFRHGPSGSDNRGDCYALIKDWFKLNRNVDLMEMPRDDGWWSENIGQNLYLEYFEEAGFKIVDRAYPKVGDVLLGELRSRVGVPNHGGIYVGNGMLMHHLPKRYSRIEPVINWNTYITYWMRHDSTD